VWAFTVILAYVVHTLFEHAEPKKMTLRWSKMSGCCRCWTYDLCHGGSDWIGARGIQGDISVPIRWRKRPLDLIVTKEHTEGEQERRKALFYDLTSICRNVETEIYTEILEGDSYPPLSAPF